MVNSAPPAQRGLDGLLGCAVALVLAGGLLGSCSERTAQEPPVVAAPFPPPVALVQPEAPKSPVPKAKPAPPVRREVAALPPQPAVMIPVPGTAVEDRPSGTRPGSVRPQSLVGMTEAETLDLLGLPVWIQETPPAKTWQYASDRCVLRVFMFMEMSTRDFRTLSYELTSTDDNPDVDQQCLAELVAQAWRTGPGSDAAAGARGPGG